MWFIKKLFYEVMIPINYTLKLLFGFEGLPDKINMIENV